MDITRERATQLILEKFFKQCYDYWKRDGKDNRTAFANAIEDIKCIKYNPFKLNGELIDVKIKKEFIQYKKMDLGKE